MWAGIVMEHAVHETIAKSGPPEFVVKMIACEQILMEWELFTTKLWGRLAHLASPAGRESE